MAKWKFLCIRTAQESFVGPEIPVIIQCTDEQVLRWLGHGLKDLVPGSRLGWKEELPSGELHTIQLNYQREPENVSYGRTVWWAIKQLCEHGWEPLPPLLADSVTYYYLRLREEGSQDAPERD